MGCLGGGDGGLGWVDWATIIYDQRLGKMGLVGEKGSWMRNVYILVMWINDMI